MKKFNYFLVFAFAIFTISVQAQFEIGDVRVIGYQLSGNDNIAIITLAPSQPNEKIYIALEPTNSTTTYNEVTKTMGNRPTIVLTFPNYSMPAGTVLKLDNIKTSTVGVAPANTATAVTEGPQFNLGSNQKIVIFKGDNRFNVDYFISGFAFGTSVQYSHFADNYHGLDPVNVTILGQNISNNWTMLNSLANPIELHKIENMLNDPITWDVDRSNNLNFSSIPNAVTVTIGTTIWNGTQWSEGVPTKRIGAEIDAALVSNDFVSYNLKVNPVAVMSLNPGAVLNVLNELNNLGTIELKADNTGYAQVALPIPSINNAGQFTVEQYFGGMTGWYSISVPVEGATIASLPVSGGDIWLSGARTNFFTWNAATAEWNVPAAKSEVLTPGTGYYAYMGKRTNTTFVGELPFTMSVTGTPVLTNKTIGLAYNDGTNSSATFTDANNKQGWNLMANPYPAALDVEKMGLPNGSAIYINQQGQWVSYINGVGTNGASRYIAPFQAFFIQTSAAQSFTFTPEMTAAIVEGNTNSPSIFKTAGEKSIIRASVTSNANSVSDGMAIAFRTGADINATVGEDAFKLANSNDFPSFYSVQGQNTLSVNVRPNVEAGDTIQLGFEYATSGQMTIDFDMSEFDARYDVYLLDTWTNTIHNANQAYTFMHDENYPADRFSLVFARNSMNVDANIEKSVDAWVFENNGEHSLRLGQDASVTIYDMNGRSVAQFNGQAGNNALPQLTNGMYIIRLDGVQTIKWVK